MTYRTPDTTAHHVLKGVDTAITQRFYLADETSPTVTAVSAVVYDEDGTIIDTYTGSWSSPTATATVLGTDTSALSIPTTSWSVIWKLTIGGVVVESRRSAYLIPREVYPSILSSDLTAAYPELSDIRTAAQLKADIVEGWDAVTRDLEARGVSVHWSSDPGQVAILHLLKTAGLAYRKAATDEQDATWKAEAMRLIGDDGVGGEYGTKLAAPLSIDIDEDKVEDTSPAIVANADDFWQRGRVS